METIQTSEGQTLTIKPVPIDQQTKEPFLLRKTFQSRLALAGVIIAPILLIILIVKLSKKND